MQITSGTAKVTSGDHKRVEFSGMTPADAALLASSQLFKFQGETLLWFTIASVVSVSPPVVLLTSDYNGATPLDSFATYVIAKDFTPIRKLLELGPNDIDIRDMITQSLRIIDPLLGTGGGGSGLTASGVASVSTNAVTKTVTGTFPAGGNYVVLVSPNWMTEVMVRPSSKTTSQYILDFSVPAPSGAEVNWGVV